MSHNTLRKGISLAEVFLLILAMIYLYPFYLMLFVSVKSSSEAIMDPSSFPKEFHPENFITAMQKMDFLVTFSNSFIITAVGVAGVVALGGMASFIIAKSKVKAFHLLYLLFISGTIIPFFTAMVPLIVIMKNLGLNNSRIGLALVYVGKGLPFGIFLYTGFIRGLPNSLTESAQIDGANKWQTYWRIVFPMIKPITASVIIIDVLWFWNDFLLPLLALGRKRLFTIPLVQFNFQNEYGVRLELAFAAYFVGMLPILILYFLLQKNIVKGMTQGALKG